MNPRSIDLNCDLGEGAGHDAELMPLVTSANIACGLHAGDEATMHATVALALRHGVAIGAHPSFDDREHFGRRELVCDLHELKRCVLGQIHRLQRIAATHGAMLVHVKPHGALYNMAARDLALAQVVAEAVREVDSGLVLVGLHGSALIAAGEALGFLEFFGLQQPAQFHLLRIGDAETNGERRGEIRRQRQGVSIQADGFRGERIFE